MAVMIVNTFAGWSVSFRMAGSSIGLPRAGLLLEDQELQQRRGEPIGDRDKFPVTEDAAMVA